MPRRDPKLEKMIEEVAEQDCETPEDVAMGLCYAIQEHVRFPVAGKVIGEEVTVVGVEEGDGVEVMAICERKGRKYPSTPARRAPHCAARWGRMGRRLRPVPATRRVGNAAGVTRSRLIR